MKGKRRATVAEFPGLVSSPRRSRWDSVLLQCMAGCCGNFNGSLLCEGRARQERQITMGKCTLCTLERLRALALEPWVTQTSETSRTSGNMVGPGEGRDS